jgi:chaperonin GroES
MKIQDLINEVNIAEKLDDKQLAKIGSDVVEGYDTDEASCKEWRDHIEEWTKMALQISDKKTFPWTGASNVKFPLLSTAAMQFAARAYPTLVPSDGQVVKCKVIGSDLDGSKNKRATRISKHMSYQLMYEMEEWEEDMDKLLVTLPIVGTVFKKTYYDPELIRNKSCLVMPKNLVVNYWTRNLEDCERITEVHEFSRRKVQEKINKGIYLDVDLGDPQVAEHQSRNNSDPNSMLMPESDDTTPYIVLEQHRFLDLDDDGYAEPYVVLVEKASKKVLRIAPRFSSEDVQVDDSEKVVSISPKNYYTKYSFFPNPDGGFYDIGFGRLIGPINASVDTLINQLIDAGSLSNLQAGFIGKGLRVKMGDAKFTPGEWKAVNATGDDIKKQIFPLPVREPSEVLFKLLQLLSQSAQQLASVAEIFVGKMPGQNTPATTTMASIEQGMKLFTAVYKRVYRSLAKEFQKLYLLNREYMDPQIEMDILDEPMEQSDYQGSEKDVVPSADPTAASQQERLQKAQSMLQLLQLGTINPQEVTVRLLEAMEIPDIEKILMQPQPPAPDPKIEALKMKAGIDQQKANNDIELSRAKLQMQAASEEQKLAMKQQMQEADLQGKEREAILKARLAEMDSRVAMSQSVQNHQVEMAKGMDAHQMKMQQQREAAKSKPTKKGNK